MPETVGEVCYDADRVVGELRRERTRIGLTQREVGQRMGRGRSFISNIESRGHLPSLPTLMGYASALGCGLVLAVADGTGAVLMRQAKATPVAKGRTDQQRRPRPSRQFDLNDGGEL